MAEPVEPVAWRYWKDKWSCWEYSNTRLEFPSVPAGTKMEPLFAVPPQRKPLTREKAIALWADKSDGPSNGEIVSYCRAIERAHGIGGNDE